MNIRSADALVRLFPFLSKIEMPQGMIDCERNAPSSHITMISTTVGVLVREDLHPAIVSYWPKRWWRRIVSPASITGPGNFRLTRTRNFRWRRRRSTITAAGRPS